MQRFSRQASRVHAFLYARSPRLRLDALLLADLRVHVYQEEADEEFHRTKHRSVDGKAEGPTVGTVSGKISVHTKVARRRSRLFQRPGEAIDARVHG